MRLLNTTSFEFKEFFDTNIPQYAILSHRWGDQEVSHQDFLDSKNMEGEGGVKIQNCCALAKRRHIRWVWVDTCCIDKKSSAELSEAINSMYRWYVNAIECYVHLSDVRWIKDDEASREMFRRSKWFTRGWTLQELLAPFNVEFFDCQWGYIGDKQRLFHEISTVTGIHADYLGNAKHEQDACVAETMSWVSERETSRTEDLAYCMLGLFNVNMPLLYGEGKKAFKRLQQEIMKKPGDASIFAWASDKPVLDMEDRILALWPDAFKNSRGIQYLEHEHVGSLWFNTVFHTHKGLQYYVPAQTSVVDRKYQAGPPEKILLEPEDLECGRHELILKLGYVQRSGEDPKKFIAIRLQKLPGFRRTWFRPDCTRFDEYSPGMTWPRLAKNMKIYLQDVRWE
ncbi:MAG: hypothetical protein Q9218_006783 [Villophora microphyllina]